MPTRALSQMHEARSKKPDPITPPASWLLDMAEWLLDMAEWICDKARSRQGLSGLSHGNLLHSCFRYL